MADSRSDTEPSAESGVASAPAGEAPESGDDAAGPSSADDSSSPDDSADGDTEALPHDERGAA